MVKLETILTPPTSPNAVSIVMQDNDRNLKILKYFFDQVWIINLKRREDRLARFWEGINKSHWPFRRPQVFNAIEGDKVGVPKFWQTGGGSYGCMRSHNLYNYQGNLTRAAGYLNGKIAAADTTQGVITQVWLGCYQYNHGAVVPPTGTTPTQLLNSSNKNVKASAEYAKHIFTYMGYPWPT
jgi:hypothetical protein